MASKVLIISGDSDNRVHMREWRVAQKRDLSQLDWNEEFLSMLDHYAANGHYVAMGFREVNPDYPPDERIISVLHIPGHFEVVDHGN